MSGLNWCDTSEALRGFGGEVVCLRIPKTGLAYFDALRLYGAIDLFIGLREETEIHDEGWAWRVTSLRRPTRLQHRAVSAFRRVAGPRQGSDAQRYLAEILGSLVKGIPPSSTRDVPVKGALQGVDAALQTGVRGVAALDYDTLETSQTSRKECQAGVALPDAVLAYAGKRRTETVGEITFLPLYEGVVDLAKVVSPLRFGRGMSSVNPLCDQAYVLLALRTSLFAEGYHERLSGVVFTTSRPSKSSFNYSGLVSIHSTAVARIATAELANHAFGVYRRIYQETIRAIGERRGDADRLRNGLMEMAAWVLQPTVGSLQSLVSSQEKRYADAGLSSSSTLFAPPHRYAKEVFAMTCGDWKGDYEAVKSFAKAVSSAIYYARILPLTSNPGCTNEEKGKAWYDEVSLLRSAPTLRQFLDRALVLLEQGHRASPYVGTERRGEAYSPPALLESIGEGQHSYERFRLLFRMYLIQESKPWVSPSETTERSTGQAPSASAY